jgi:hypothetical protein
MFTVSFNVVLLAVFYTLLGGTISFLFYYLFDEHNEEWETQTLFYKILDVFIEIAFISLLAFWMIWFIRDAPPILPVSKELDSFADTYISGIFFTYSMFIFLDDLGKKLKHLYIQSFGTHFDKIMPTFGSLVNLSLSYTPKPKTN